MRLTFKLNSPFTGKEQYYPDAVKNGEIDFNKQTECNNKLGQIEDIEEELGIDLITLLKALKNGIYANDGDTWNGDELSVSFEHKCLFFEWDNGEGIHHREDFYFKDYGKTWALTKEELL